LERATPVKYVLTGVFIPPLPVPVYPAAQAIEGLGGAKRGDQEFEDCYLALPAEHEVGTREVRRLSGDTAVYVDAVSNPASLSLWFGGLYRGECLIAGSFAAAVGNPVARRLFESLLGEAKEAFEWSKSFFVGPEARRFLAGGGRLTRQTRLPPSEDFRG
jgi:hypothetical protein